MLFNSELAKDNEEACNILDKLNVELRAGYRYEFVQLVNDYPIEVDER